ncbi:MAG: multi-sensor signal transduction histidine kinase [candidate division NC10 bacterium]|nr:multi-sensor signal transduction histidine kinase [candidate division NC10 bacterium]
MAKRALVVDNDRLCVELLGDILSQEGYEVSKAFDGMEAMEALQTSLPDIVFLDLVMPKIDGDRVFQYIRTHPRTCHIPIVIVSGTLVEDARDALNMKADGYVAKSRREDLERNILTVLKRLETGEAEAGREILGLEHLIPRHKVKELLAVRRFSQTVLRTIVEGIAEVDGRQRVLFVNRACLEMVGRPELDLIGIQVANLLTAEHRATLEATIAAFLSASEGSGEPVTLRYRGRVLRVTCAWIAPGDAAQGLFMILRDVTDLASKIEELSALNARLQAMDRMRSELLTMVSHDLHTPLTAIKGSLEVLLHETVGIELRRELLGIAQKNADRLFRMVSDILDLARIEAGRFQGRREPFDVLTILRGTIDRLRQLSQDRGIAVTLTVPEASLMVSADSLRMEQVFTNLLGNALKFTPRGGRIDVAAEERGADILVTVADSGVGIPPEHLDRVFDRFYRVPMPAGSAVEGTGLGLSICRAVVEEHGGRIWVESQVGRGSTFFVTIPRLAESR